MEARTKGTKNNITVVLVPKAATELARMRNRTGLSETDILNRAISLYNMVDEARASGAELLLCRRDGSTYRVELR